MVMPFSESSTCTSSFVNPGRSARNTSSLSRSNISTGGDQSPGARSAAPVIGASHPRPSPKSSNRLSISSLNRFMKANGVAARRLATSSLLRVCKEVGALLVFVFAVFFRFAIFLLHFLSSCYRHPVLVSPSRTVGCLSVRLSATQIAFYRMLWIQTMVGATTMPDHPGKKVIRCSRVLLCVFFVVLRRCVKRPASRGNLAQRRQGAKMRKVKLRYCLRRAKFVIISDSITYFDEALIDLYEHTITASAK